MLQYIVVEWVHSHPDEPIWLYSEIDERRWEKRKIEVYRDGSAGFADGSKASGSTKLSIEELPPLEEIAADPQFKPRVIDQSEFEEAWGKYVGADTE